MKVNTLKLSPRNMPISLRSVEPKPSELYWAGTTLDEILARPRVAIVGSRNATNYGRWVTHDLTSKLARTGVVVISGLAFGIDSNAHKAALEAGGCTVAVLPSPLEKIYPSSHHNLAGQILKANGALVSEYAAGTNVRNFNFIARNRLISGLADVLVITEAAKNSGSLHTARFALEQGKTVMAVPGNINSPISEGCNNLIKSGAIPVTDVSDIFFALKVKPTAKPVTIVKGTPEQRQIFELIAGGVREQEELAAASQLSIPEISGALTILELRGYIRPMGGGVWTIA
ncbi:DNA-protecting protein DprA [Candidatus Saccharibacteria bacterium]|nr:DNA-protecting protein DprA [Candidatus Saccharibacteria bacterium]MBI2285559.1 DNA-protecting protein DprA [Candidatus Saccharibacteria bacterium]